MLFSKTSIYQTVTLSVDWTIFDDICRQKLSQNAGNAVSKFPVILIPYQTKAYKICYKKIAILFDSNESASFLRPIYEDVMIAFHELLTQSDFCFSIIRFFPIQSAKKLYWIAVKSYAIFCKSTQRNPE